MDTDMSDNDAVRDFVQSELASRGLNSEAIPVSSYKTPDLALPLEENRVLIEVKSREDDEQFREIVDSPAGTARFYKTGTIENLLRSAWHQIRDFPERTEQDFTIIWLVARKPGITAFAVPAAMTTLYGIQTMEGLTEATDSPYEKKCFFFGNSFFFRQQKLDGVVLHENNRIRLCLNPFSLRRDDFRKTAFVELFQNELELIDPKSEEESGEAFIADCAINRKDPNSVVRYLKRKYGLRTVVLHQFVLVNRPVG